MDREWNDFSEDMRPQKDIRNLKPQSPLFRVQRKLLRTSRPSFTSKLSLVRGEVESAIFTQPE